MTKQIDLGGSLTPVGTSISLQRIGYGVCGESLIFHRNQQFATHKIYTNLEDQIASWSSQRDALAAQIKPMLEGAEFNGQSIDELQAFRIIIQGQALLDRARGCAFDPGVCGA